MRPLFFPAPGPAAYTQFHSMLCSPNVAAACVPSFDGTIIFMPSTYEPNAFQAATQQQAALLPYEVTKLTVAKYYFLVLWSLTGLSSLLRQTQTIQASDDRADKGSHVAEPLRSHPLAVDTLVVDAIAARHGTVRLVRRFEFRFRLVGLWVAMHHYAARDVSGRETLSLVEVYRLSKVCVAVAWAAAGLTLDFLLRRVVLAAA